MQSSTELWKFYINSYINPYTIVTSFLLLPTIILGASHISSQQASSQEPHIITFFFRPLHEKNIRELSEEEMEPYINRPGRIYSALLKQRALATWISGIYVFYNGKSTYSDFNGQILLPRTGTEDEISIVITELVIPIILHGTTVEYFTLPHASKAAMYQCIRTPDTTGRAKWHVTKKLLDTKGQIPAKALIILANPEYITLFEGDYITDMSAHLILPDIYVSPSTLVSLEALRTLSINHFFMPTRSWFAHADERYATITT